MSQKKTKSPGYRYATFTAEQVAQWGLVSAEAGTLKLDVDDFGAKLRVPQTRAALDEALAKLLSRPVESDEQPNRSFHEFAPPGVADYQDTIDELRQALSKELDKRKAAEDNAARLKTEAARGGNLVDTTVEGCFDNLKTGFREVWGQGKRDRAWPKRKVDQMAPRHGKPWGTFPDHPHNRAE